MAPGEAGRGSRDCWLRSTGPGLLRSSSTAPALLCELHASPQEPGASGGQWERRLSHSPQQGRGSPVWRGRRSRQLRDAGAPREGTARAGTRAWTGRRTVEQMEGWMASASAGR